MGIIQRVAEERPGGLRDPSPKQGGSGGRAARSTSEARSSKAHTSEARTFEDFTIVTIARASLTVRAQRHRVGLTRHGRRASFDYWASASEQDQSLLALHALEDWLREAELGQRGFDFLSYQIEEGDWNGYRAHMVWRGCVRAAEQAHELGLDWELINELIVSLESRQR